MISYKRKILSNGLTVIVHEDKSTPLATVNVMYKVGSRNENPNHTGFAHLFEHLMFSGSTHIEDYDTPIQEAGGENNAFTNSDYTNFYNILPAQNIETALWLESDRMHNLIIDQRALEIQKKVVVEEFKETCLNNPYGDVWHKISSLAYRQHPYNWPTIGKDFSHIELSALEDVKAFYKKFYHPGNAILVLAGGITYEQGFDLAEKWFAEIPSGAAHNQTLPQEPNQTIKRVQYVKGNVPVLSLYKVFHMVDRNHDDYYVADLLSDVLSNGKSSRLIHRLYKEKKLFNEIDAYITGTFDPGLFVVEGKPTENQKVDDLLNAIDKELEEVCHSLISDEELTKIKNKAENSLVFSEVNTLNKAISLAYFENLGDIDKINTQKNAYLDITSADIQRVANDVFRPENSSTLVYEPG